MKSKTKRYNEFYMDLAKRTAEMSYATRLKVGAIAVKNGQILSFGFNGMPAGMPNICEEWDAESGKNVTRPEVQHAEENLIAKLAKNGGVGAEWSTVYVTHAPCIRCAKLMAASGIRHVVWGEQYRDNNGVELLKKLHIKVEQIDTI